MERIGHYKIEKELGRGGMGVVYKAYEESLNRYVAIKVLGEHLTHSPEYVRRFVKEAQSAAQLSHPNIVHIHFIGEEDGRHYFVMEHVAGRSLQQVIREEGKIDGRRATRWILEAASGLAAAHERGVVHRDIKPGNLILTDGGTIKIADFGLALLPDDVTRLTASGMLLGTPGYLSPEQCQGQQADARSDIYSLGVTFYELLTGVMPFSADSPFAVIQRIVQVEPPPVSTLNPEVDAEIQQVLSRMMAKDPAERYPAARELAADLEGHLAPSLHTKGTLRMASAPPAPAVAPPPTAQAAVEPGGASRRALLWVAVFLVFATVAVGGVGAAAWRLGWIDKAWSFARGGAEGAVEPQTEADTASLDDGETTREADDTGELAAAEPDETGLGFADLPGGVVAEVTLDEPGDEEPPADEAPRTSAEPDAAGDLGPAQPPRARPQPLRGRLEARRAARSGAAATSPPERPPARARGTAVVAVGEPILAGPLERYLEARLGARGVELVDERADAQIATLLSVGAPVAPREVLAALRGRARRLVLARVEPLGERQLLYMGRYDTAYQSRVTLVAFDLASGQPVARSRVRELEYTRVETGRSAENALRQEVAALVDDLGGS